MVTTNEQRDVVIGIPNELDNAQVAEDVSRIISAAERGQAEAENREDTNEYFRMGSTMDGERITAIIMGLKPEIVSAAVVALRDRAVQVDELASALDHSKVRKVELMALYSAIGNWLNDDLQIIENTRNMLL